MTAACDRGCTASVGLLVPKEIKRKERREQRATDRKSTQLMGIYTGNYSWGGGGVKGGVSELF